MDYHTKRYFLLFLLLAIGNFLFAQLTVRGTVYDSTKSIPVKDVLVKSNSGSSTTTDSTGYYIILITPDDSLVFVYNNKATAKFSSRQVPDNGVLDISLHVRVRDKFKTLKEVRVFTKTYKEDSLENRITYNDVFNYQKPGIKTTTPEYGAAAGMDLDEFINIFRFRRNKQMQKLQQRLEEAEKDKFIDYRFNKRLVKRITRLDGNDLDLFMQTYRPSFEFTQYSSTVDFYQYILDASYEYKRRKLETEARQVNTE